MSASAPDTPPSSHRIFAHPILGPLAERRQVFFECEERRIEAREGEPIAAALLVAGVRVFRKTAKLGQPRTLYCGIGRCTDCVMIVDGQPNVRTCVTAVRDGMRIEFQDGRGRWGRGRGKAGR